MEKVTICDVGPRDGLQNEKSPVSTEDKQRLVDELVQAGVDQIELTSFVSPKAVPQMADAAELVAYARRYPQAHFRTLIINEKGYERAVAAGATAIAIVLVTTETFCQKNNRMSVAESLATTKRLLVRAKHDGIWSRVYLAAAWVCHYEGPTPRDTVLRLADEVWEAGVDELALADTIGHAHPLEVGELCEIVGQRYDMSRVAVHVHDTTAMGLANCAAAISAGVRRLDGAVAGLGGCPFAPGAAGNLATEDLVYMVHKMGFHTGVDLDKLWQVVLSVEAMVGRPVGGRTRKFWESRRG
jgi:hydroxymethylglutaryl-CoA lyase